MQKHIRTSLPGNKLVFFNLLVISAVVLCFEIISTRITSVIFVNNYAFIILSLAIMGLGSGGIFSYYKIPLESNKHLIKIVIRTEIIFGSSLLVFILSIIVLSITTPFFFFLLIFIPFFIAGIIFALLFKTYADQSFTLYAADLVGAAMGSAMAIGIFNFFNAVNAILFLSILIFCCAVSLSGMYLNIQKKWAVSSALLFAAILLMIYGESNFLGKIPIGNYPEKDFYHVYPDPRVQSKIIESKWSIYGRSDLVEYSHQDVVKQLFIDGAAGTQMYRFNGDIKKPDNLLSNLLISHSTAIPILWREDDKAKNNMLVIGSGGGKEVLIGLLSGVKNITGIEINPDFVDIVKKYKDFNGGIYTDFKNVNILVKEGRHFIKQTKLKYDLVVMALPSTEQLQSIDNFAANENFLLTVEAIRDYLKILTPEGQLVFTVHNRWELMRLLVTAFKAFELEGINNTAALNHFIILGQEVEPTVVIKKNACTREEAEYLKSYINISSRGTPSVTYLPFYLTENQNLIENQLLENIKNDPDYLNRYVNTHKYDISPVEDDSPYFYKVQRGIPKDYLWLLICVIFFDILAVFVPFPRAKKKEKKNTAQAVKLPLQIFICIGVGFMILEISLFQKMILYLGSPTISLSILLGSLLIGMGSGSFFCKNIYKNDVLKRINRISILIVLIGLVSIVVYPFILNALLIYSQVVRAIVSFILLLPLGFFLGIPFPSTIQLLKNNNLEKFIPWMYGVNGIMSVTGSVTAVILSMLIGFVYSFLIGIFMYFMVFLLTKTIDVSLMSTHPKIRR